MTYDPITLWSYMKTKVEDYKNFKAVWCYCYWEELNFWL